MDTFWFFVVGLAGTVVGAVITGVLPRLRQARGSADALSGAETTEPVTIAQGSNQPGEQHASRGDERLREIAQMTGGLAHEIKNPLSTIGLNTRLLGELLGELDLPADQASRLTRRADALRREIERLEGILTDFLEYAGEPRLDAAPTDLNELVREVTDFFLPQCEQRGVRLHVQFAASPAIALVDGAQLKQAILNLMLNAVQAMESRQQPAVARELIVRVAPQSQGIVIHVTDTGPGIDQATRERIFHPYFTTKAGGSGLGLPITRKLVEAMGGRVDLHSEPGRGTDVQLWFPSTASGVR